MRSLFGVACLSWILGGCTYFSHFSVYKLDVNQGNYITVDQVDKLKVGQTRQQVRLVLGTPLLADYLEDALSQFGESCEDLDADRL